MIFFSSDSIPSGNDIRLGFETWPGTRVETLDFRAGLLLWPVSDGGFESIPVFDHPKHPGPGDAISININVTL